MVSPLEPQSDGYIGTLLESRGGSDLFGSMSLSYISLCSGASVGITKAAMVHQHDLSSHRTDRERRMVTETVGAGTPASQHISTRLAYRGQS